MWYLHSHSKDSLTLKHCLGREDISKSSLIYHLSFVLEINLKKIQQEPVFSHIIVIVIISSHILGLFFCLFSYNSKGEIYHN